MFTLLGAVNGSRLPLSLALTLRVLLDKDTALAGATVVVCVTAVLFLAALCS